MPPRIKPYRFHDLERWTRSQLAVLKTFMAYLPGSGLGSDFKQTMRESLGKITGAEVDLWLDSVNQMTGAQALAELPDPACLVVVGLQPSEHRVLLDVDLKLAGTVVDKMLGGSGEDADPARPLSSIEKGIVGFVLLRALHAAQTVLAEEQQVALRLLHMHERPSELADYFKGRDFVMVGFKIFLDMQVAYARLLMPVEMVRTQLAAPSDPAGPVYARRLASVRHNLPRVNSARTHLSVEAGRSELSPDDLAGVEAGDILMVEQTGLRYDGGNLTGSLEIRVGNGTKGVVRGTLVQLEGGGSGVEITGIECFPEPDPANEDAEPPQEASPQDAVNAGEEASSEEEQARHTPLQPRGGAQAAAGREARVRAAFAGRARGAGGDALNQEDFSGEHQVDEDQQYEEQADGGEAPAEDAGPQDNLAETESLLNDVPMPVVVELGRIKTTAGDVVKLRPGQILELRRTPNDPVDITVNGKLVGKGELVEVEGELGVRLLSLVR